MAAVFNKFIEKFDQINPNQIIQWILTDSKDPEISSVGVSKHEFVPSLLNFLRDETWLLLSANHPSTSNTPAKSNIAQRTPKSALKNACFDTRTGKRISDNILDVSQNTSFNQSQSNSCCNFQTPLNHRSLISPLSLTTPSNSNSSALDAKSTSNPAALHRIHLKGRVGSRENPTNESQHSNDRHSGSNSSDRHDGRRHRQRRSLADFMSGDSMKGRQVGERELIPHLESTPTELISSRRTRVEKVCKTDSTEKKSTRGRRVPLSSLNNSVDEVSTSLSVFNLSSCDDFPDISGSEKLRDSKSFRRLSTTLVTSDSSLKPLPIKETESAINPFQNATFVPAPATAMPRAVWAVPQKSDLQEVGTRLVDVEEEKSRNDSSAESTGLPRPVLFDAELNENQIKASNDKHSTVEPSLHQVTCLYELQWIADVYARCILEGLVPNLILEIYFLIRLLTVTVSDDNQEGVGRKYLNNVHNCVYFSTRVLLHLSSILLLLDRATVTLLTECSRLDEFCVELKQTITNGLTLETTNVQPMFQVTSPLGGVTFHAETDNKKQFSTEQNFHLFKKQRDLFYTLIREWENCHTDVGWCMKTEQGARIHQLVDARIELTNQIHFVRLFILQLIKVCLVPSPDSVSHKNPADDLNIQLGNIDPKKLKRLQDRLVAPRRPGEIYPAPSFPAYQEFFKNFLLIAAHYRFNRLVAEALIDKIIEIESSLRNSFLDNSEVDNLSSEQSDTLMNGLSTLRVLGKFLGLILFMPHQSSEYLDPQIIQHSVTVRSQCRELVDLEQHLSVSMVEGRVLLCVSWMIDSLSMMDSVTPLIPAHHALLTRLVQLHRYYSTRLQKMRSHNSLFIVTLLGWLFELPVFPADVYYSAISLNVTQTQPTTQSKVCVDETEILDQRILYACCPHLAVLRDVLHDFNTGVHTRQNTGGTARKVTLISAHSPQRDLDISNTAEEFFGPNSTQAKLQKQLEDCFFNNHSSLRRTVDFVSDRVMSNYIKRFQADTKQRLVELGRAKALQEAERCCTSESNQEESVRTESLRRLEAVAHELKASAITEGKENSESYCSEKVPSVMSLILSSSLSDRVKQVAVSICLRNACYKVSTWINKYITSDYFMRELTNELDKQIRVIKQSTSGEYNKTLNTTDKVEPAVDTVSHVTEHIESVMSPSQCLTQLKELCRRLMMTDDSVDAELICDTLQTTRLTLTHRQDLIPAVASDIISLSTSLAYTLVRNDSDMWSRKLEERFVELWSSGGAVYKQKVLQILKHRKSTSTKNSSQTHCDERLNSLIETLNAEL